MTKRILCLLLAFVMLFGVCATLASCQPDEPVDPNYKDEGDRTDDEFDNEADKAVSKYYDYTWSTTNLNVEISEHTAEGELISRTKRYLAGEDPNAKDALDEDVRKRNSNAEKVTRTKIKYNYLPDIAANGWGDNIERIVNASKSYSDKSADVYINFIYDMVGASLLGAFANLKSVTMPGSNGINYFEFAAGDYSPVVDDEGYMYDLMNSLSFSTKKVYVLTSDYLIDTVRAFFVVPVNLKMVNGIDVTMVERYDYDQNGVFDTNDFFNIIWENDWNYEAVKVLSAAVAVQVGETSNLMNDTHGFALGSGKSGIHGVGILYGSDVEIITRELGDDGFYKVYYPASAEDSGYAQFCDALAELFSSKGVTNVDKETSTHTCADYIEDLFVADQLLLGGIICAGNLEKTGYQEMKTDLDGGFGVAPVPMYREFDQTKDIDEYDRNRYYRTASHNIAKCAAISVVTTKFKQASAWLDYQSTHSSDILDTYYEEKLQYAIAGGLTDGAMENVKVLGMLRENVSTALDKCYDDAIKAYSQVDKRWCALIRTADWKIDIRSEYNAAVQVKQDWLKSIQEKYNYLPE